MELTSSAREVRTRPGYTANELNELYCLRCHDKMGIPICGACRSESNFLKDKLNSSFILVIHSRKTENKYYFTAT
jgi:hypothetical protein